MACSPRCPCHGKPVKRPRECPVCGHVFKGNGWDGIDAHYRQKKNPHEKKTGLRYEDWWNRICPEHRS